MAAIKRKQAEWMAQFLDTDIEIVLQCFDDVSDDEPAGDAEDPDEGEDAGREPEDDAEDDAEPGARDEPNEGDDDAEAAEPHNKGGQTPPAEPTEKAAGAQPGQDKGFADPMPVASPAIPVILIIQGAKYLTRELVATVTVTNDTEQTLTLDKGAQMAHGELKKKPKLSLAPKESDTFTAHSVSLLSVLDGIPVIEWLGKGLDKLIGSPSLAGVEGTLKYLVGDASTTWTCHFLYPRMITSSKEGTGTVGGQNPNGVQDNSTPPGSDDKWAFDISGKGGGGGGGGQAAGAVTVRVAINNSSDQTIYLRHQENPGGEFMTNPKPKLGPGEQDSFMYGAAASDKTRACRGKLYYDVGDPKLVEWELMWDNPVTQKNISASFLNPKDQKTGLHTLDQIDNGDENVPATYTLSGKGGGPAPVTGGAYAVTIDNKTDAELTLTNSNVTGGTLVPPLPAKLAAGAGAQLQFTPDPAAKSNVVSAIWSVGQSGTGWHIKGTVPAGADPASEGTLDPANPKLSSTNSAAKTATGGTFAFAVSGTVGPLDKPDDKFVPPPKGKQPTLRKGDNSADGWVEYAQQLINDYKLGKELPVDGNFSPEMENFVKTVVQPKFGCLPDGVIGNETWSALREGPREKVGTDGRKPHTFEEKGPQARFVTEASDIVFYDAPSDGLSLVVVSTGEQPIDTFNATLKLTQPDGTSHVHAMPIGKPYKKSPDGQGDFHAVRFDGASQLFQLAKGVTPDMCAIDAYLDEAIGGDRLTVPPKIKPK